MAESSTITREDDQPSGFPAQYLVDNLLYFSLLGTGQLLGLLVSFFINRPAEMALQKPFQNASMGLIFCLQSRDSVEKLLQSFDLLGIYSGHRETFRVRLWGLRRADGIVAQICSPDQCVLAPADALDIAGAA